MAVIFELVRKLVMVAIFAGFGELLLPEGRFRSFVRFAVGLVVIVLMLQPLMALRGIKFNAEALLGEEVAGALGWQGREQLQAETQTLVEAELTEKVIQLLAADYPGWRAQVKLNVEFDQQGSLAAFTSMEVDLFPEETENNGIEPVIIGAKEKPSPPPGLSEELAEQLGIPGDKLILRLRSRG